jgi:hypothetical protein
MMLIHSADVLSLSVAVSCLQSPIYLADFNRVFLRSSSWFTFRFQLNSANWLTFWKGIGSDLFCSFLLWWDLPGIPPYFYYIHWIPPQLPQTPQLQVGGKVQTEKEIWTYDLALDTQEGGGSHVPYHTG